MRARAQKVTSPRQASFGYRLKASQSFPFKWHFHPEYELTLILESSGTRFVGDSNESYEDGDLVLLGPNLPHTWLSDPAAAAAACRSGTRPSREWSFKRWGLPPKELVRTMSDPAST